MDNKNDSHQESTDNISPRHRPDANRGRVVGGPHQTAAGKGVGDGYAPRRNVVFRSDVRNHQTQQGQIVEVDFDAVSRVCISLRRRDGTIIRLADEPNRQHYRGSRPADIRRATFANPTIAGVGLGGNCATVSENRYDMPHSLWCVGRNGRQNRAEQGQDAIRGKRFDSRSSCHGGNRRRPTRTNNLSRYRANFAQNYKKYPSEKPEAKGGIILIFPHTT